MQKYELIPEGDLYRLKALRDIGRNVKVGDLGGLVKNADILSQDNDVWFDHKVIVYGGTFHGGNFHGGNFHGGTFHDGYFHGGTFHGGTFHGGTFYGGNFYGGYFHDGNFNGGIFNDGYFHDGYFHGGTFHGGYFHGGNFMQISNIGSRSDILTIVNNNNKLLFMTGCFCGEEKELRSRLEKSDKKTKAEYLTAIRLTKLRLLKKANNA